MTTLAISNAGTAGATYIHPPLHLIRQIDPIVSSDLPPINPSDGTYTSYCMNSGCDYTVQVTYDDGLTLYRVIQGEFRSFNPPGASVPASATDPGMPAAAPSVQAASLGADFGGFATISGGQRNSIQVRGWIDLWLISRSCWSVSPATSSSRTGICAQAE